jgi:anaerobic selenocysteine-containing dehydrogenase/N-acetylglutamate synthase-like GNAT family acetyltransferase
MAEGGQMADVRKANCHQCGYLCGVEVWVGKNERIEKIVPDTSRYPYDASVMNRCHRFAVLLDHLDHPDRVNYPLKRIGKRGAGQWQQVTWDEAMGDIADRLKGLKTEHGAETLATCISAPHAIYWPLHRFLNLWGSPNNIGIGISCWNPRIWVNSLTYGWPTEDELEPGVTRCVIMWGINPAESDHSLMWKTLNDFKNTSGKIIVIDPRRTRTARLADHFLQIKSGTDGVLALGLLHVIIHQNLYDASFVENWCAGFGALTKRVKDYSPETVSRITGIASTTIEQIARRYAQSKPASIFTGLGIDMSGVNCTQTLRAIAILRAVTGNLDTPGASYIHERPDFIPEVEMELSKVFPQEQREKKLGKDLFALQRYDGYERLTQETTKHGKELPARYLTSAHPHLAWEAMITGEPYPIRALITMASNPLLCQADTHRVYEALKGLDLLVCLEHTITPTAMLADYVLPMAGSLEKSMVQTNGGTANLAYGGPAAIKPRHERRTAYDFWYNLGRRCGQKKYWRWETLEEALDAMLLPAGVSWADVCQEGLYAPEQTYNKYQTDGFATPSGKVELASALLKELGHDPLPDYKPVAKDDSAYPLQLMTGVRKQPYYSSEFRQVKRLRRRYTDPVAEMAPGTAEKLGLAEGDVIWIETARGRIQQKLSLSDMQEDLVSVDYGWWFPEETAAEPELGGLWTANANVLTSADTAGCDPILGQWSFRTLSCKVYKAPVALRPAEEKDREALLALLLENEMEYDGAIEDFQITVHDEQLVGCIRLEDFEDLVMIRPVVVAERHRKSGIGRFMVESVLHATKPVGIAARGDSISFYEALGFEKTNWHKIPDEQENECRSCPDEGSCRPQPMIHAGIANSDS